MERTRRLGEMILGVALTVGALGLSGQAGAATSSLANATFAGGCFWCMEEVFEGVEGVVSVVSGYTGGRKANPTYEEVSDGWTGHAEAIELQFDPAKVSYGRLLEVFWQNVDPTTPDRQFCDRGHQYRTAVFYHDQEQRRLVEESQWNIEQTKRFEEPIVTEIVAASTFYPAEEYHQDFYKKNPIRYKFYKFNCGRTQRLEDLWGTTTG